MSVSTNFYVLVYENKELIKEIEIENFKIMRFDDGIYYTIWDSYNNNENDKKEYMKRYNLSEDEYNNLQFYNYWCEDILEVIDEDNYESVNNFNKVPKDKIISISNLLKLLEKIYRIESNLLSKNHKYFLSEILENKQNDIFKIKKRNLSNFFSFDSGIQKRFNKITEEFSQKFNNMTNSDFLQLLSFIIGCLTTLEKDYKENEVQIVFYQS